MAYDFSTGLGVEREYLMRGEPSENGFREASNVWLEADGGTLAMRIGYESAYPENWAEPEIWLDVALPDGRVFSYRDKGKRHNPLADDGEARYLGAGPLRFTCIEPYKRWTASYYSEVSATNAGELISQNFPETFPTEHVAFMIDMEMVCPIWVPGALLPEAKKALGGDQGDFMSPRYEQLFRACGKLQVGAECHEFSASGLRIRRQGFRAFAGFWGHCWQSAFFPESGRAFGCNAYPPREDGAPSYNEAWLIFARGEAPVPARVVEVPWLKRLLEKGDDTSFVLETIDGRRVAIQGETVMTTRSRGSAILPPDFPLVVQAHSKFTWDDEEAYGMTERSSKPSVMEL